jgi:hypothetical protein
LLDALDRLADRSNVNDGRSTQISPEIIGGNMYYEILFTIPYKVQLFENRKHKTSWNYPVTYLLS